MQKDKTLHWIKNEVNKKLNKWDELTSEAGVSQAAKRYAERLKLPWPISR